MQVSWPRGVHVSFFIRCSSAGFLFIFETKALISFLLTVLHLISPPPFPLGTQSGMLHSRLLYFIQVWSATDSRDFLFDSAEAQGLAYLFEVQRLGHCSLICLVQAALKRNCSVRFCLWQQFVIYAVWVKGEHGSVGMCVVWDLPPSSKLRGKLLSLILPKMKLLICCFWFFKKGFLLKMCD